MEIVGQVEDQKWQNKRIVFSFRFFFFLYFYDRKLGQLTTSWRRVWITKSKKTRKEQTHSVDIRLTNELVSLSKIVQVQFPFMFWFLLFTWRNNFSSFRCFVSFLFVWATGEWNKWFIFIPFFSVLDSALFCSLFVSPSSAFTTFVFAQSKWKTELNETCLLRTMTYDIFVFSVLFFVVVNDFVILMFTNSLFNGKIVNEWMKQKLKLVTNGNEIFVAGAAKLTRQKTEKEEKKRKWAMSTCLNTCGFASMSIKGSLLRLLLFFYLCFAHTIKGQTSDW